MLTEWRQRSVLCLQVFPRHPQIATVIRLSCGHLLPTSRPAGHNQRVQHDRQHRFAPNARSILESRLPCGASTDAQIPMLNLC
ncbi:hypothetical protein LF1_54960 [Rubripirellula obstinata]|uniref:Uncharacterized protein n=1 Tax=Rubripirellula obstinata TaxID=406547 RepID=A0A5B1C998_9BACT|nr:hypothetical protein LF1_58630 [Rubripirellula obstinata]KAA1257096.1 hypothetical protein LF1_54960 [Rubripirellula obstinata]